MNYEKIAATLKYLRLQKNLTQKQIGTQLGVTEQAVSKWERGLGLPDISLCPVLADILGVNLTVILTGDIEENTEVNHTMKNLKYHCCPTCGNVVVSLTEATISCCGRPLQVLPMKKTADSQKMTVTEVEDERYLSCDHPMTKEDYISFTAFATGERLEVFRHYPEWNLERRVPKNYHGQFIWYSKKEGLLYQLL